MLLYSPDEHHLGVGALFHSLQSVDSQSECEAGPTATCNENDLVVVNGIRERAVWSVNRRLQYRSRMSGGVLVQVAGEAVVRLDDELERIGADNGKRVHLESADSRDPDEEMLPAISPGRNLLHDNLGATVGQWMDCRVVVGKVVESASCSDDPVGKPHGRRQNENDDDLLAKVRLVEACAYDADDEEAYVRHVEQLVPNRANHKCRYRDAQKGEARDDGSDLLLLDE